MKVAVVLAKFPSGWRALVVGEDPAAIRKDFKAVKVAGSLVHEGEAAEVALYFDSAGTMMRKFLRTPDANEAVEAAAEAEEERIALLAEAKLDEIAQADGRAQAVAIAEKAVAVITEAVTGGGESAAPGAVVPPVIVAPQSAPVATASAATSPAPMPAGMLADLRNLVNEAEAKFSETPPATPPPSASVPALGGGEQAADDDEGDAAARFRAPGKGPAGGKPAKK